MANGQQQENGESTIQDPPLPSEPPVEGKKSSRVIVLIFGQAIAFAQAFNNTLTYVLVVRLGFNLPIFEIFIMYSCLTLHLLWLPRIRQQEVIDVDEQEEEEEEAREVMGEQQETTPPPPPPRRFLCTNIELKAPWWNYLLLSIIDVYGNYLALLSLKFTSITSSNLLSTLTTPSTMVLAHYLMKRHFQLPHYVGVVLCLMGAALTMYNDVGHTDDRTYPHAWRGDILALFAAVFYALSDSLSEVFVKNFDRKEYLGMLGLFGALISLIQFPLMEGAQLHELFFETPSAKQWTFFGVMAIYVSGVLFYYIVETLFLVDGDVTLMELSLQTSNLWAIVLSIAVAHTLPSTLFYLAMVLIVSGVFVYEVCGANKFGANEVDQTLQENLVSSTSNEDHGTEESVPLDERKHSLYESLS